jgi:hypothetical protein
VELLRTNEEGSGKSAWEEFRKDDRIRRTYNITTDEMEMLANIAAMGDIVSPRDFVYILHTIRHALGR